MASLPKFNFLNNEIVIKKILFICLALNTIHAFAQRVNKESFTEIELREWLSQETYDPIEGIWIFSYDGGGNYMKSAVIEIDGQLIEICLECYGAMRKKCIRKGMIGRQLSTVRKTSIDGVYNWTENDKNFNSILKEGSFMEATMQTWAGTLNIHGLKEFPIQTAQVKETAPSIINVPTPEVRQNTVEWKGNGSGVILSRAGHIVTNYHVVEGMNLIEAEFILNGEYRSFRCEEIVKDKINDLAILKITDSNFPGIPEPPFNVKFSSSDVGTKVYAYGYPMAFVMGKELKVTDGMISSRTGFNGNITTYQITAPIQGGNSGGPLFDESANMIGINSSGLNKALADNVGYTIKASYIQALADVMPDSSFDLPSNNGLKNADLVDQIKAISDYVVLLKVR